MNSIYMFGMRVIALASTAIAIYVLVGSWKFPSWWYGFFWGGEAKLGYVKAGAEHLIDNYFWPAISIIFLFISVVLSLVALGQILFRLVDRFAGVIISCAVMAILLDVLVLRPHRADPVQ